MIPNPFIEAMRAYHNQMAWESHVCEASKVEACKALEAESIYRAALTRVNETVIAALRAKGDATFAAFADALESDDFAALAV